MCIIDLMDVKIDFRQVILLFLNSPFLYIFRIYQYFLSPARSPLFTALLLPEPFRSDAALRPAFLCLLEFIHLFSCKLFHVFIVLL